MRYTQEENFPVIQNINGKVSLKTSLKPQHRVIMAQQLLLEDFRTKTNIRVAEKKIHEAMNTEHSN